MRLFARLLMLLRQYYLRLRFRYFLFYWDMSNCTRILSANIRSTYSLFSVMPTLSQHLLGAFKQKLIPKKLNCIIFFYND